LIFLIYEVFVSIAVSKVLSASSSSTSVASQGLVPASHCVLTDFAVQKHISSFLPQKDRGNWSLLWRKSCPQLGGEELLSIFRLRQLDMDPPRNCPPVQKDRSWTLGETVFRLEWHGYDGEWVFIWTKGVATSTQVSHLCDLQPISATRFLWIGKNQIAIQELVDRSPPDNDRMWMYRDSFSQKEIEFYYPKPSPIKHVQIIKYRRISHYIACVFKIFYHQINCRLFGTLLTPPPRNCFFLIDVKDCPLQVVFRKGMKENGDFASTEDMLFIKEAEEYDLCQAYQFKQKPTLIWTHQEPLFQDRFEFNTQSSLQTRIRECVANHKWVAYHAVGTLFIKDPRTGKKLGEVNLARQILSETIRSQSSSSIAIEENLRNPNVELALRGDLLFIAYQGFFSIRNLSFQSQTPWMNLRSPLHIPRQDSNESLDDPLISFNAELALELGPQDSVLVTNVSLLTSNLLQRREDPKILKRLCSQKTVTSAEEWFQAAQRCSYVERGVRTRSFSELNFIVLPDVRRCCARQPSLALAGPSSAAASASASSSVSSSSSASSSTHVNGSSSSASAAAVEESSDPAQPQNGGSSRKRKVSDSDSDGVDGKKDEKKLKAERD
jgi:hypothetical protein